MVVNKKNNEVIVKWLSGSSWVWFAICVVNMSALIPKTEFDNYNSSFN